VASPPKIPASTAAHPSEGLAREVRGLVPLLMAVSFLCYVNRLSIATAGDARIMAEYGFSPTRMGTVYSAFLVTYTICMIPGGLFIDRFRPRAALLAVVAGSSGFVALTGLIGLTIRDGAAAYAALLTVRGLMGVVSAPLYPACASAIGRWVPSGSRSRTNGLVTGSALVGVAATPPLFGALIDAVGWPSAFLIAACATVGLATLWARLVTEPSEPEAERPPHPRQPSPGWRTLRYRSLILLTVSYGAVGYFQYLFFYWMAYYFEKVLHLSETASRGYAALPPLAMAVGMPLGGWLCDRLEETLGPGIARRGVPMAGMILGGLFLIAGLFAAEPSWIVLWFSLALGAVGTAEGPFWVTAIELGGRRGGSAAAVFNTGGNAGGLLAPVLTPWVGEHYGWTWAVALGALVCLVGVALWTFIEVGPSTREHAPRR
jgi:ACS family D-galactonate transporter-like MFS transporter